jgi:hypothetical protein
VKVLPKSRKKKDEDKEKEIAIYKKIIPSDSLMDYEGWKVFVFKGVYATRLPTLIQEI